MNENGIGRVCELHVTYLYGEDEDEQSPNLI